MKQLGSFVRNWPTTVFFTFSLLSILAIFFSRGALLDSYFHPAPSDSAMDFFNVLSSGASDFPYTAGSNYPPLCYILLKLLHYFVPAGTPSEAQLLSLNVASPGFFLRNYELSFLVYIAYTVLCVVVIVLSVCHICTNVNEGRRVTCVLMVIISGPMLFLLERGNILIFALATTFLFLSFYRSDSRGLRGLAYFSIAFASGLKIYPFIFSFLLIRERRAKDFLIVLVLTLVAYVVPFALLGGFDAVAGFLHGLMSFTAEHSSHGTGLQYSIVNIYNIIQLLTGFSIPSWLVLLTIFIACFLGIFLIIFSKQRWHGELCAGLMCAFIPSVSYTYNLVFLLPALVEAVAHRDLTGDECETPSTTVCESTLLFALVISQCVITLPIVAVSGNTFEEVTYPLFGSCLIINILLILQILLLTKLCLTDNLLKLRRRVQTNSVNDSIL